MTDNDKIRLMLVDMLKSILESEATPSVALLSLCAGADDTDRCLQAGLEVEVGGLLPLDFSKQKHLKDLEESKKREYIEALAGLDIGVRLIISLQEKPNLLKEVSLN